MNFATDIQTQFDAIEPNGLSGLREDALAEFKRLGFPSTRMEEWKYTSLKEVTEKSFGMHVPPGTGVESFFRNLPLADLASTRLVFINGQLSKALSHVNEAAGIAVTTMQEARHAHAAVFEKHFGKYAEVKGESLNALNTAFAADGAFIHVQAGMATEPVMLLHIADSTSEPCLQQPRNLVVVDANASLEMIEAYYATGQNASFTNAVNEVYVGEGATFRHYKIQQEEGAEKYHNNFTQVFQEKDSNIESVTITLAGKLVRNNLHFYMHGENCNTLLYGLYITAAQSHVDNHTRVDHASPSCFSNELYKGILRDKSSAVFNGKILVHPDAQKTNAYQRNQNILLSEQAVVNTKPQLEIFADDVKCTHGATVGQLDEEALFYLRSRGIGQDEARRLLLNAFADDIAEQIRMSKLVPVIEEEISKKL
jgi:Fe-S cluster assembly protein SufD